MLIDARRIGTQTPTAGPLTKTVNRFCCRGQRYTQRVIVVRMSAEHPTPIRELRPGETILGAELVEPQPSLQRPRPRQLLPIILFVATCVSTYLVGGPAFSFALMFTLLAHELGHYLQALRYGVPASLSYFIPMPISPIGTMGAVIMMAPGMGNRRTLFDIAITGPLAGLVPALVFCVIGLQ